SQLPFLLKVMSHALGPKGLIHGQALDLSHEMNHSFDLLLLTHELKTARLIQTSLVAGSILAHDKLDYSALKKAWRLGYAIGITFQLLDDLGELTQENLSLHETDVNPWPNRTLACSNKTLDLLSVIDKTSGEHVRAELKVYFKKTLKRLDENQAS